MLRIKSPQDLGAAVILAIIGLGGLWFGRDLETGTIEQMGPGYLPIVLSWCLLGFAAIVLLRALSAGGPPIDRMVPRAIILVIASIVLFALLIDSAGFAVTVFVVTVSAAFGSREVRPPEAAVLGVALSIFSVLVFVYALRQSLPVWWWST